MACMATPKACGNLMLSPHLQLQDSEGRQVKRQVRLQGAVNWKVGEKSTRLFAPIITRRKERHSPSTLVRNEATDAEPKADLDPGERGERSSTEQAAMLHRRELVWAATGAFSYLSSAGIVHADGDPVPPTNMAKKDCRLVGIKGPVAFQECCQPDGSTLKPKEFKFEPLPMRTRKPAHILSKDPEYVKKYNEAYKRMIDLPDEDPRSFRNQWRVHCSFCNGVYPEPGNIYGSPLQYHGAWAFLPWHRMYLYFHERILGELINDPSFALPFWNWDNQRREDGGNQMPLMYVEERGKENDHLRCALRNLENYPPMSVDITDPYGPLKDYEQLRTNNLSILHTAVVATVAPISFFGGPYRPNLPKEQIGIDAGSVEKNTHNTLHQWTGGRYNPNREDMGIFVYAARDPIFFAHHANVDRLWSVWQTLDPSTDRATRSRRRARKEPNDSGFRNTKFAFYDHNKDLVEVRIEQTVDSRFLRYKYQAMPSDNDWINFRKRPSGARKPSPSEIEPFGKLTPVISKDQPSTFRLLRRVPTDPEVEEFTVDDVEETLVLTGAKLSMDSFTLFKVFINLPSADENTPLDVQEFVGLLSHVPHAGLMGEPDTPKDTKVFTLRLSLGAAIKALEIDDEESVTVTFVPGGAQKEDVTFKHLTVEFV